MATINGKQAGAVGYGMLGLTIPWVPVEYSTAVKLLKTALEQGANLWNGVSFVGFPPQHSV